MSKYKKTELPEASGTMVLLKPSTWKKITATLALIESSFSSDDFVVKQTAKGKQISLRSTVEAANHLGNLEITSVRQPYHEEPSIPASSDAARVYVTFGHVDNMIPDNIDKHFDLREGDKLYLVVNVSNSSGSYEASSVLLLASSSYLDSSEEEESGNSINRLNYLIGRRSSDGTVSISNSHNKTVTTMLTDFSLSGNGVSTTSICLLL